MYTKRLCLFCKQQIIFNLAPCRVACSHCGEINYFKRLGDPLPKEESDNIYKYLSLNAKAEQQINASAPAQTKHYIQDMDPPDGDDFSLCLCKIQPRLP